VAVALDESAIVASCEVDIGRRKPIPAHLLLNGGDQFVARRRLDIVLQGIRIVVPETFKIKAVKRVFSLSSSLPPSCYEVCKHLVARTVGFHLSE